MSTTQLTTTRTLFATTHNALLRGDFVTARTGLETLARSADHVDLLCAHALYLNRFPVMQREPLLARMREADNTAHRNMSRAAN